MINRRGFLKLSALAAPGALSFGDVFAQSDVIQFGCPVPMSGPFAANGKFADMGMKLMLQKYGKVLGRNLSYTAIDTEGKPATAVRKMQEAIEKGTHFFAGGSLSSEALAMGKEAEKANSIFITYAGADEITGTECNRATFRWSAPTFGAIGQTVRPLLDKLPNAKRWYTITPQYVFGDGLLSAAKAVFKEKGIEHVGNSYHSLAEKEFSGYLTNAMAAKPDVLLLLNFGSQSSDTLRQAVSFGMKNHMTILMAWASGLEQFETLGADICDGVYFGAQYWHAIDSPFNKEFVKFVNSSLTIDPNYSLASSSICTKILLDAIIKANSTDPKAVIAAMEGMKYEGLTGTEEIRKGDHQVLKNYYLLKGKAKSKMRSKNDYADIVSFGKSFLPLDKTMCKIA
ncbi:ABC transporter substrate-binding protein [Undibacterium arcticum]|uniref:ABC transporter substrate-binding protein n=1 Tax=Undibacterium arcticum TaxID=1762892 RepID=A0ABV7F834_9BURK